MTDINDFILVKIANKKRILHYLGQFVEKNNEAKNYKVNYLKKKYGCYKYFFPGHEDKWIVQLSGIIFKLPR